MKTLKTVLSLFLIVIIALCSYAPVYAMPESNVNISKSVMSEKLINKLNSSTNTDIIEVIVWIKDIDYEDVELEVKEKTGLKKADIRDELGREKNKKLYF